MWAGRMTGQHGPVLRFMRHDAQREQLLSSGKEREERRKVEKLRVPQFFSSDALQSGRLILALTRTVSVPFSLVSFMPVAHGRLAVPTTSAVAEGSEVKILWQVMNVPKMQQAGGTSGPRPD